MLAVDDPLLVRGVQCVGDLRGDGQCFRDRHRPPRDALVERRTFDQLEDECGY
jgi:hypothetical protein